MRCRHDAKNTEQCDGHWTVPTILGTLKLSLCSSRTVMVMEMVTAMVMVMVIVMEMVMEMEMVMMMEMVITMVMVMVMVKSVRVYLCIGRGSV